MVRDSLFSIYFILVLGISALTYAAVVMLRLTKTYYSDSIQNFTVKRLQNIH